MIFRKPRQHPDASSDLTSFIDIVLLLVIFFMLTAQFAKSQATPIDLPREKGEVVASPGDAAIVIDLKKDGRMIVAMEEILLDRLQQLVVADAKRLGLKPAELEIVIRADRLCPAGFLNKLTAGLSSVGVRRWKLATDADTASDSGARGGDRGGNGGSGG